MGLIVSILAGTVVVLIITVISNVLMIGDLEGRMNEVKEYLDDEKDDLDQRLEEVEERLGINQSEARDPDLEEEGED